MTEVEVRYIHRKLGPGHATVAYYADGAYLHLGLAFCSPKDQFCKKTGRTIAKGRLFSKRRHTVVYTGTDFAPGKEAEKFLQTSWDWPGWAYKESV